MSAKVCVYCGRQATTRDHLPPRCLLERPLPHNLATVPSCAKCNAGFSLDEQYLLVLLTEISTQHTLTAKRADGGTVNRALMRAPALQERFFKALQFDDEGAIVIRPEFDRVNRVIQKIGLGLFVLRYNRIPRLSDVWPVAAYPYDVRDDRPVPLFISTFTERFRSKQWRHIQKGVFSYIIVRDPLHSEKVWCVMDFHQTLWGVAHFPNPRSVKARRNEQLWLFDSTAD